MPDGGLWESGSCKARVEIFLGEGNLYLRPIPTVARTVVKLLAIVYKQLYLVWWSDCS